MTTSLETKLMILRHGWSVFDMDVLLNGQVVEGWRGLDQYEPDDANEPQWMCPEIDPFISAPERQSSDL